MPSYVDISSWTMDTTNDSYSYRYYTSPEQMELPFKESWANRKFDWKEIQDFVERNPELARRIHEHAMERAGIMKFHRIADRKIIM